MSNAQKPVVVKKYPSDYGSHEVMVNAELSEQLEDKGLAVLQDDDGLYLTSRKRFSDGLSDPARYAPADHKLHKLQLVLPNVAFVVNENRVELKSTDQVEEVSQPV